MTRYYNDDHQGFKKGLKDALGINKGYSSNNWRGHEQFIGQSENEKLFNQFDRTIDLIDKKGRVQPEHKNDMVLVHKASKDYLHDIMNKYLDDRETINQDITKTPAMKKLALKELDEKIFQELELIRIANGKYHEKDWTGFLSRVAHGLFDSSRFSPYTTASLAFTVTLTCALLVTTCLGLAAAGPLGWAALAIGAVFMALHVWNVCNKARLPTTAEQTKNQIKLLKEWDHIKKREYSEVTLKQDAIITKNKEPLKELEVKIQRQIYIVNLSSVNPVGEWENKIKTCKTNIDEKIKAIDEMIVTIKDTGNNEGDTPENKNKLKSLDDEKKELEKELFELINDPPDYKNHLDLDRLKEFIVLTERKENLEQNPLNQNNLMQQDQLEQINSEIGLKFGAEDNTYETFYKNHCGEFKTTYLETYKATKTKEKVNKEYGESKKDVQEAQTNLDNYRDKMGYNEDKTGLSSDSTPNRRPRL